MDALIKYILKRNRVHQKLIEIVIDFLLQDEYDSDAFILDLEETQIDQDVKINNRISNLYQLWGDCIYDCRNYMRYYKCLSFIFM